MVPALIMVIAVFMILNQLKIAPQIVTLTYTFLLGSVALAGALAFGLGGREVAARMLEDAYQKGREQKGQVEEDAELAKRRAEAMAEEGKQKLDEKKGPSGGGPAARPA